MPLRTSNHRPLLLLACAVGLSATLVSTNAKADDADKAACADKSEGDACTRGDGGAGTCVPDDDDPVLTCEDSIGGDDDDSNDDDSNDDDDDGPSCSVATDTPAGSVMLALGMIVGLARRRRRV